MLDPRKDPKQAFPWLCIKCGELFRGTAAYKGSWGRVCSACWQTAKERAYDEISLEFQKD